MESIFKKRDLGDILDEIQEVYTQHDYPWVIGYSGGKDSTATTQLIWQAVSRLPEEERTKQIHVISTNTLVETPAIVDHVQSSHKRMEKHAEEQNMPVSTHLLEPQVDDTFWVNMIGRGYPAPNNIFRWCTDRMKIQPSNRFIMQRVAKNGNVILALGSRRGESATRDQVLEMHEVEGMKHLNRHGQLHGAWVYMPVEHFTVDDIWKYLVQVDSPWGNDNRKLAHMYQTAQDGECPVVVDTTTPSCGNSRFGCWTCTVVERDRSMEAMIDSGEEWMVPLLEFRDWLKETQDPDNKPEQRKHRGRDGTVKIRDSGKLLYRTYKLDFSKEMLRRLLETQKEVQRLNPGYEDLISELELHRIRQIWITERQDWEDSLPDIYEDVMDESLDWREEDISKPGGVEADVLREVADEHDVSEEMMRKLIDAEWQHHGMRRRATIHKDIENIMSEDWRSREEVLEEAARKARQHEDAQEEAAQEADQEETVAA
jgi:DNA sulfur modification protein DndC